jgi:hypothetical protein
MLNPRVKQQQTCRCCSHVVFAHVHAARAISSKPLDGGRQLLIMCTSESAPLSPLLPNTKFLSPVFALDRHIHAHTPAMRVAVVAAALWLPLQQQCASGFHAASRITKRPRSSSSAPGHASTAARVIAAVQHQHHSGRRRHVLHTISMVDVDIAESSAGDDLVAGEMI